MRRSFLLLTAAAGIGLMTTEASACCHKKACVETVACPAPAPVAKKGCFKMPKLGCHKQVAYAPAACETVSYAPAPYAPTYSAPVYASGQAMPSMQMPSMQR